MRKTSNTQRVIDAQDHDGIIKQASRAALDAAVEVVRDVMEVSEKIGREMGMPDQVRKTIIFTLKEAARRINAIEVQTRCVVVKDSKHEVLN